jgi:hypothetical protein
MARTAFGSQRRHLLVVKSVRTKRVALKLVANVLTTFLIAPLLNYEEDDPIH